MNSAETYQQTRDQNMVKVITDSGQRTNETGRKLGSLISDAFVSGNFKSTNMTSGNRGYEKFAIALYGDLGAGKTTFVQGFARGLGVPEQYYITSPTYNIINEYPSSISSSRDFESKKGKYSDTLTLYHIDLYRIGSADELEYIGFDDIAASDNSVIIIEWPDIIDKNDNIIIAFDMKIYINTDHDFNRKISLIPYGLDAINLLKQFA